jgi:hypothetical protein
MRGKDNGKYPYHYLEMLNRIFGPDINTIEVCSGNNSEYKSDSKLFTVDINSAKKPSLIDDAQYLRKIPSDGYKNKFSR